MRTATERLLLRLEWRVVRRLDGRLQGGYRTAHRGSGIDFVGLRIKVSGCFNSCGQHHVADIGFFGNSRKVDGYTVPHFQVVLGGR